MEPNTLQWIAIAVLFCVGVGNVIVTTGWASHFRALIEEISKKLNKHTLRSSNR